MNRTILLFLAVFTFGCQENSQQTPETTAPDTAVVPGPAQSFLELFEEVNVVKMHLFATAEATPTPDKYPYVGKPITGEALQLLGNDLSPGEGNVFACYRTENSGHFILRVPGKYADNDLAMAKWDADAGKLKKVADLASLWCDEGACNQQDAWLADLDDSRTLELILRSFHKDEKGKLSDEQFTVMTDDGTGNFKPAGEELTLLAVKENYVMRK